MSKKITSFFIFLVSFCIIFPTFFLEVDSVCAKSVPNDYYYKEQWYLDKIKASDAWDKISASPDVVIAVIDSGTQINHPDLVGNIWVNTGEISGNGIDDDKNGFIDDRNGWDFVNNSPDPSPKFETGFTNAGISHGTLVAGIIGAVGNNKIGISGVTQMTKIMPLRALNEKGEGRIKEVVRAIDYAINNGADIINLSFINFDYSQALAEAISRAYKAGIIVVAAAGRGEAYDLDTTPMYPICYDGINGENMVIGVAATDALDQKTSFSSYGFKCIDIAAPGVSIYGTSVFEPTKYYNGEYFNKYYDGYWNGTSYAAPMVSGALALIEQANPNLNRNEVVKTLLTNADNISRLNPKYLGQLGSGRLNLDKAISDALGKLHNEIFGIITAPASGKESLIKISDLNGATSTEFFAFDKNFRGGVNIVSGDLNNDGANEIVTSPNSSGGPQIRIFNSTGRVLNQFFAFEKNFRGGVNLAAGDVNHDGIEEIVVSSGAGWLPQIKIFNLNGKLLSQFLAYDKNFRGGVNVATGDVDGDGVEEIIAGAGPGGGPHVRIFNLNGKLLSQFFAYDKNFRGGVRVATGDVDGGAAKKRSEIITAAGSGGGPHVKVFNNKAVLLSQFFAYDKNFRGGVNIAAADMDQDGLEEVITGAGIGGAPHVKIFELGGKLVGSYFAYEANFSGGVNVGFLAIKK